MSHHLIQYYRCPERVVRLGVKGELSETPGYFRFGSDLVCHGKLGGQAPNRSPGGSLTDASEHVITNNGITYLPFDATEVIDNLRYELYTESSSQLKSRLSSVVSEAYYLARPLLPVTIRRHLQKAWLADWNQLTFPRWPVDSTVDALLERLLVMLLQVERAERGETGESIPFIWFWPDGASSCAVMTHDVETASGRDFCVRVMDCEESWGIRSCFTVVPEQRYAVTAAFLSSIWRRGFEVAVQDLNHDGRLFSKRDEYLARAEKINSYGAEFGASGFRSAVLYRNQMWFDALKFSYDMSVPSVAHLEPQRGGCCTVMPYFVGDILELPVTTTQDYALFNYLNSYSTDLWRHQIELIRERHGLINMIIHPDYIRRQREWKAYNDILGHLVKLRETDGLWITTPREVDRWWRQRAGMKLIETPDGVQIEGEGKERATIAYARESGGRPTYSW